MRTSELSPWFLWGLYLFGLALMATAAVDLLTTVWPFRFGEVAWRYGFLGLAAGYLQTPTLGLVLIALAAHADERPGLIQAVALVCLATSVALVLVMGVFAMDVLQMRAIRGADTQGAVLTGAVFQELKYLMATVVFLLLGIGGRRTAKKLARRLGG